MTSPACYRPKRSSRPHDATLITIRSAVVPSTLLVLLNSRLGNISISLQDKLTVTHQLQIGNFVALWLKFISDRMSEVSEQMIPKDKTGDNGRRPYKARARDSLIIDQLDREIEAEVTHPIGMSTISEKEHQSVIICRHVVSGKSTTTGRLLFEVGGIPDRELEKLKYEAEHLEKPPFALTCYMDRQKEEWERGVDIAGATKEFFTDKWHYIIIDTPGQRDSIKNMIAAESQAVVAITMVSADGKFTTEIAKCNHKAEEIQRQMRQRSGLKMMQFYIGGERGDLSVCSAEF